MYRGAKDSLVCDVIHWRGDLEGGSEKGINLPRVTQPVGTGQGIFPLSLCWDREPAGRVGLGWGGTQGGKIRPVSQEVSVYHCRTQLLGGGTESDFPLQMGVGGTAAHLFLFTEHTPCPQSHLTALPRLPVSITRNPRNGP